MTCIAALVRDGAVHMAGDTFLHYGAIGLHMGASKVARRGEFVLGFSGDGRVYALVLNTFVPPSPPPDADLDAYMTGEFCDALFEHVESRHGLSTDEDSQRKCLSGALLVGVRGRLFFLDSFFTCAAVKGEYFAIGSGCDVALGVLYACTRSLQHLDVPDELTPGGMLEMAVEAAIHWVQSCGGDVRLVSTSDAEEGLPRGDT